MFDDFACGSLMNRRSILYLRSVIFVNAAPLDLTIKRFSVIFA